MSGEEIRIGTELQDVAADPNEVTEQFLGTHLRDAAVDPMPGDYLPWRSDDKQAQA